MMRADDLMRASAPRSPSAHLVADQQLFIPNGSQLFDVDVETFADLDAILDDEVALHDRLHALGVDAPPLIDDTPLVSPPLRALSLAVAQKCNLGCTYCYAQQGDFGASPRNMSLQTAIDAIDLMLRDASTGDRFNIAFLGGEPLANRSVIRAATEHAAKVAEQRDLDVTFSITTNGTLLTTDDAAFFEDHAFAVTISIDGIGAAHDALRPTKAGEGTFDRIMERAGALLALQQKMQVSARVTVTPRNLDLRTTLDELIARGFHSVGFSPMLASPNGSGELDAASLETMLDAMIGCGAEFEQRLIAGDRYPFANMTNAMCEIHRGTHRPYPCGAGAGYLGVSADGDLAACHRFVGDEEGAMGSIANGIDRDAQNRWLASRH